MKTNIILIGMMGSGKTTIGKALGDKLQLYFRDTDQLIEQREGKISSIFESKGEKYFRDLESRVISELKNTKGSIISTGGGAILRKENVNVLGEIGYIIYLRATINTLIRNLSSSEEVRPLLLGDNPSLKLQEILNARQDIYIGASDYVINVDDKSIEEICDLVIQYYQMNNNNNV